MTYKTLSQIQLRVMTDALRLEPDGARETLMPRAALGEIVSICDSVVRGSEPPRAKDRRSLAADVSRALSALGKELARELSPALADFRNGELKELPRLLDEGGGTVRLRHAAETLDRRLAEPTAAVAAWRDLVVSAQAGADLNSCSLRALQLREIDELRGHEWIWRRQRLIEAIGGDELAECEELIAQPPSRTARVAWLAFARADIHPRGYQRIGQVQFFSDRLLPEALQSERFFSDIPEGECPKELDEEGLSWLKIDDDVERPVVYARVELTGPRADSPANPWAHGMAPAAWARRLVDGIVKAATFRLGGSRWQLLEGDAIYHGTLTDKSGTFGSWSGGTPFQDPYQAEIRREYVAPPNDRTGTALEALDPDFVSRLARGDGETDEAVREIDWFESAEKQSDPAQRLILRVRGLERALPTTDTWHWDEAATYYSREFWALEAIRNQLFSLAHRSETALRHQTVDLAQLESWITHEGDGYFTVALGPFLRNTPKIVSLLDSDGPALHLQRELRSISRWDDDPDQVVKLLERRSQEFDTLMARGLRQRNAITHGLETREAVVLSVDPFISRLAGLLVSQAVHGAAVSEEVVEALARSRDESRTKFSRLRDGQKPVSKVLFAGEDS